MSYQELIDALRREAEEKIATIRREAEIKAARVQTEAEARLDRLRRESLKRQSSAGREDVLVILAAAEQRALRIRLEALKELSERLYSLALSSLPELREPQYGKLFAALVRELPSYPWETVRVNPADVEMAGRFFPGAHVVPDDTVSGGLEVTGDAGRICIDNTLEKRLERGWQDLLPILVSAIRREFGV
jgi:vacuolar-type H+-ATPase subunit E/Vma4